MTATYQPENLVSFDLDNRGQKHKFNLPNDEVSRDILTKIITGKTYPSQPFLADIVDCVFDVGANIGAASVYFRFAFPKAKIYAYEPNELSLHLLHPNTAPWGNIEIFTYGWFDEDKKVPIHISGESGECSSIKLAYGKVKGTVEEIELKAALNEINTRAPDAKNICLKIDTEGCEAEILESLTSVYDRIAIVFLEYHSEKQRRRVDKCLSENGFTLFSADASMPHRGDLFFINNRLIKDDPKWNFLAID